MTCAHRGGYRVIYLISLLTVCARVIVTEATVGVVSVGRDTSSPKAMDTVSNAATMAPITTAGTLVSLLELADTQAVGGDHDIGVCCTMY